KCAIGTRSIATAARTPIPFTRPTGSSLSARTSSAAANALSSFTLGAGRRGTETVRSLRTTRHLISNLWVEATADREAKAFGVISFYDGSGRAPVHESNPPVMVADLLNICVRDDEGAWRFKSHRLRPVFMGAEVPLSLAVDLTR